ncbi:MAG TPA: hypothetical protein VLH16_05135 [Bacteroidales bacterium]|nr:hypothetical protein [Bacteroidales bacterium]
MQSIKKSLKFLIRSFEAGGLHLPGVALAIVAAGIIYINVNYGIWKKNNGVLMHDIKSYYSYLPAAIIHNDLTFRFTHQDREFFKDKLFLQRAPNGSYYQKMTMGLAIMYLPFFMMGHITALLSPAPADGYSIPYMFFLLFSALFYLLAGLIIVRKILLNHFKPWIVAFVIVSVVFGTNLLFYTTYQAAMPHVYNFFLFAVFLYLTIKWHCRPSWGVSVLIGITGGLIILVRPTNGIIALVFLLYNVAGWSDLLTRKTLLRNYVAHLTLMIFVAFIVFSPQMIYWKLLTGNWMFWSYGQERFVFENPNIINGLFSYRKGWLLYTPLMAFALVGIPLLFKHAREYIIPVSVFTVVNIYIVFSWWNWWYGGGFSARPMIDSYPLMALGLAAFLKQSRLAGKWMISIMVGLFALFIFHNLFQTRQFLNGAIHFDSMTRQAYWDSFGRLYPSENFPDLIATPDIEKALQGVDATLPQSRTRLSGQTKIGFDAIHEDRKFFVSDDNLFFLSDADYQATNIGRGETHAIMLHQGRQFATRLDLRVRPGEEYRFSIWRYPAHQRGTLVISGWKEEDFYDTAKPVNIIDADGWEQLSINVTIPAEHVHWLKIYLWNQSADTIYFDDMQVVRLNPH